MVRQPAGLRIPSSGGLILSCRLTPCRTTAGTSSTPDMEGTHFLRFKTPGKHAAPCFSRLFLAGEAIHPRWSGYLQGREGVQPLGRKPWRSQVPGALVSGREKALEVESFLRSEASLATSEGKSVHSRRAHIGGRVAKQGDFQGRGDVQTCERAAEPLQLFALRRVSIWAKIHASAPRNEMGA